jgi:2-aminoadipate transaminase
MKLAEVLHRMGEPIAVIEDAAYRDLYFTQEHPARSIVSLDAFKGISCLYLATLTKSFATGLKIGSGYCTDGEWLKRILWLKGHHDFGSSSFTQAILESVLSDGRFDSHLRVIHEVYQEKMNALHAALCDEGLATVGWKWKKPLGGLYLWLKAPEGTDTRMGSDFWEACCRNGVLYVPGDLCYGGVEVFDNVRLSFGVLSKENLVGAAHRFTETAKLFSEIE